MLQPQTTPIHLHLLGHYRLEASQQETLLKGRRFEEVFAFLALHQNKGVNRDTLLITFWPDHSEESARNNLRQVLHQIRHLLTKTSTQNSSSEWILENHGQVSLNPDRIIIDIHQFERCIREGNRSDALCHYRGELLPGWSQEWIIAPRQHFLETFLATLNTLIQQSKRENNLPQAIAYALQAREADPLSEDACQTLIELYQKTNHPVEARRTYDNYARRLRDTLQMEPPHHLKQLLSTVQKPTPTPIVTTTLTEAPAQEEISQEKPPHAPLTALPYNTTRFFGRKTEIDDISLLLKNGAKLVTITGFGGMGKTRLSQEIAERLLLQQQYPAVYWVALTETRETEQIWSTIRTALSVKPTSGEYQSPQEQVLHTLNEKPTLLLLDNLEHLPEAILHPILTQLLAQIPTLTVLTTSRKRLRLRGEQVYELFPLPLPTAKDSLEMQQISPCIRLFLDRATVGRDAPLSTINALCRHLEGIPLAIEMAAARTRLLSPEQILTRLKQQQKGILVSAEVDAPDRHRSLQATLQWSFDLLSPSAQQLIGEISVLRGKWTVEAAEAMSSQKDILDSMTELLDASLLRAEQEADERKFSLLETMRQFADITLSEEARIILRNCHARWIENSLNNILADISLVNRIIPMERLRDNFLPALHWTLSHAENPEVGWKILELLNNYWTISGNTSEGIYWYEKAIGRISLSNMQEERIGRFIYMAFHFVSVMDNSELSQNIEDKYIHFYSQITDPEGLGMIYLGIAALSKSKGDFNTSQLYYEKADVFLLENSSHRVTLLVNRIVLFVHFKEYNEAVQLAQEGIVKFGQVRRVHSILTCQIGEAQTYLSQFESAKKHLDQAMEQFKAMGENMGVCRTTNYLGIWHFCQDQFQPAITCFRTAGLMGIEVQDMVTISTCLMRLIEATLRLGNPRRAMRLFGVYRGRLQKKQLEEYGPEETRLKGELEADGVIPRGRVGVCV
jgi:predicted ATPase/DNA-binding SARP family transcriptional activator